jgi:hypothetical protein
MIFSLIIGGKVAERQDRHVLSGVVTIDGIPAKRQIVVLENKTYSPVASTMSSAATGEWKITHISEYPIRGLLVIAKDNTGDYNSEIADHISQVTP